MKHIVFCFPGAPTLHAAMSWDELRSAFASRPDLRMSIDRGATSSVRHLRNQLLEVGVTGPMRLAKPFGGVDYDFMMWIDSDSVYRPEDFFRLLELDADIASGAVPIDLEPGRVAAGKIDVQTGETAYLQLGRLPREPMEVEWAGFAFLLVKRGVFEALSYPWFDSQYFEVGEQIVDPGEDIRWCLRVREKGFKILLHPSVRIGHEKMFILEAPAVPPPADAGPLERFIDRYDPVWRMSRPALQALKDLLERVKPRKVLELGPGASSFVLIPWCLDHGAVYQGLDHEGIYAQQHLENLRQAGLPTDSTFVSWLRPETGWYAEISLEIDAQAPYDLVVVDGPVRGRGCSAALYAYDRWRHARTAWVFDDVNRDDERKAALEVKNRGIRLIDLLIKDPDYPRTTLLLSPADIDEQLVVGDTDGNCEAAAFGPPASRGQPEAIA